MCRLYLAACERLPGVRAGLLAAEDRAVFEPVRQKLLGEYRQAAGN